MAGSDQRSRIALDVDSVLARVVPLIIDIINREKGTNFTLEDFNTWDPGKSRLNIPHPEYLAMDKSVWQTQLEEIKLFVRESVLLDLSQHYTIDIVTVRIPEIVEPLGRWLSMNLPNLKYNLVVKAQGFDKSLLDYDIYVDDSPKLAASIEKLEGKRLFLVDMPWNRDFVCDGERVVRVASTEEAIRILISLSKEKMLQRDFCRA